MHNILITLSRLDETCLKGFNYSQGTYWAVISKIHASEQFVVNPRGNMFWIILGL